MSKFRQEIDQNGYAVVPGVVPRANVEAVVRDIWEHTGVDPDQPETWYSPERIASTGMVEMYHYQSMWNNRQFDDLYQVFADLHGQKDLWVSIDRTNLKPPSVPEHPDYHHKGFMHWDADLSKYPNSHFGVQGVLALADTDADMGGFQCVPEIYQNLGDYIAEHGDSRRTDLTGHEVTKVPLKAGDLVIWTNLLAHGNGDNLSKRPRLAQYISMNPAPGDAEQRRQRVEAWQENRPMAGRNAFPGDARGIEQGRSEPARLSALGRRLLGLDAW